MFTFGIFTTHIPYLAFVAFYAYFLLFGVNKATTGEIQFGENQHKIEIYTNNHFSGSVNHAFHYEKATAANFQNLNTKISLSVQQIVHPVFQKTEYVQKCFCTSLFSRPPPAV